MAKTAEICRLPQPVLAVIRDEAGQATYLTAPTLHQARMRAESAGADEVSITPWEELSVHQG